MSWELELGACSVVSCFSGFMTGIAGELRAGAGCMQCGEFGSGFMTGTAGELRAGTGCMQCGELL